MRSLSAGRTNLYLFFFFISQHLTKKPLFNEKPRLVEDTVLHNLSLSLTKISLTFVVFFRTGFSGLSDADCTLSWLIIWSLQKQWDLHSQKQLNCAFLVLDLSNWEGTKAQARFYEIFIIDVLSKACFCCKYILIIFTTWWIRNSWEARKERKHSV